MLATHNSATGEKGHGLLSLLLTPFAKCQSKTIAQQLAAGVRMFDIRVRQDKSDDIFLPYIWRCAHGRWISQKTAHYILTQINLYGDCYVTLTLEGAADDIIRSNFLIFVNNAKRLYPRITFGGAAVKYGNDATATRVKYDYLTPFPSTWPRTKQGFLPLDGRSWHTYLPIPWLWDRLYTRKHPDEDGVATYYDFV